MWDCTIEQLPGVRGLRFTPRRRDGSALPYAEVLRLWREDEAFRSYFDKLLADAPFAGFRWETPPVTAATADGLTFEFVLLDAPGLDRTPDRDAFADRFRSLGADQTVVAFPNLGNDAVLVVPCPLGPPFAYGHLAAFVRNAPPAQRHALWRAVADAMDERLGTAPVWLSTAGMGVSWLHVRLDARPKYYGFAPYTQPAARERL